jgi:hypothetical protein
VEEPVLQVNSINTAWASSAGELGGNLLDNLGSDEDQDGVQVLIIRLKSTILFSD